MAIIKQKFFIKVLELKIKKLLYMKYTNKDYIILLYIVCRLKMSWLLARNVKFFQNKYGPSYCFDDPSGCS